MKNILKTALAVIPNLFWNLLKEKILLFSKYNETKDSERPKGILLSASSEGQKQKLDTNHYKLVTKQAFTLVELIIVIIILAILATIGFISFMGYTSQARDVVRMQDLQDIQKSIVLYQAKNGYFPEVENAKEVEIEGVKWKVGTFGKKAVEELQDISSLPLDPSTSSGYFYMTSESGLSYKLEANLENKLKNNPNTKDTKTFVLTNYKGSLPSLTNGGGTELAGICSGLEVNTCPTNPTDAKHFTFDETTGTITSFSGVVDGDVAENVVIPCEINGVKVENIGEGAFKPKSLTETNYIKSLEIPKTIKEIGNYAIMGNYQLKTIKIGNTEANITYYSISKNPKLKTIKIGKIKDIESYSIRDNEKLESLEICEAENIKDSAFNDNDNTKIIKIGKVKTIGYAAFYDPENLEKVIIGEVESIGMSAFGGRRLSKLKELEIGKVKDIGMSAFLGNRLEKVTIGEVESIGQYAFAYNGPNQDSATITDWTAGQGGTWKLDGKNWIKQ